jgi:putative spermidine/putrescine transport system permease protein
VTRVGRVAIRVATLAVLGFLYLPIAVIALYAFNQSRAQTWPILNFTTDWFGVAFANDDLHSAILLSVGVGLAATLVAIVLGTLAALALDRFAFFGRDAVSSCLSRCRGSSPAWP